MVIKVYFNGGNTIRSLLVTPKDKGNITQKSGVKYKCDGVDCDEKYIWQSSRTFGDRLKQHFRSLSPIYNHANTTGHHKGLDNISIVGRE